MAEMNGTKTHEMNGVANGTTKHEMNGIGKEVNGVGGGDNERYWIRPDLASRCTYKLGVTSLADSPHRHLKREAYLKPKILPDILHQINNTPLVRINKIGKSEGVECEILAKCEFFNAGGSIKDRIGLRMVQDAEASGKLKPGDVLIEPTSGNTGIGLALTAAVKGYRCIIVLPEKMSKEKVDVLRALGAEIIRTPTSAGFMSPESHIGVAWKLHEEIPNSHILDQYRNASNPLAHYDSTAEEIIEACDGRVDLVVCTAGTGGTIAGIARKFKEKLPQCKVVGVDPEGSILAVPEELNETDKSFYEVEGIGYDFIPTVLDRTYVDKWYKSTDKPSLQMARRLIHDEGLLCGGSSGTAMYCAIQAAKDFKLKAGQRMVVILPDSIRNYMTKFLSEDWMRARSLFDEDDHLEKQKIQPWWWSKKVRDLNVKNTATVGETDSIRDLLKLVNSEKVNHVPVIGESGDLLGVVSSSLLMDGFVKGRFNPSTSVKNVASKQFKKALLDTTLGQLSALLLDSDEYVVILADTEKEITDKNLLGVVTRLDLVNFIAADANSDAAPEQ